MPGRAGRPQEATRPSSDRVESTHRLTWPQPARRPFLGASIVHQHQRNFDHYGKPPNTSDATWIIHEFLNEYLGIDNGRLFSGNIEKFPSLQASHHKTLLKEFVGRTLYVHYPYRTEWLNLLANDSQSSTNILRANISFCRDIVVETPETSRYTASIRLRPCRKEHDQTSTLPYERYASRCHDQSVGQG